MDVELLGKATSIIAGAFPIRRALAASSKSLAERCAKPSFQLGGRATQCDEARRIVVNIAKLPDLHPGIVLNEHYEGDGEVVFQHACKLGCEGIVSKRLGSLYRSGRSPHWIKVKNPKAPAVTREADEDWGR
jgi:hypothetical protein